MNFLRSVGVTDLGSAVNTVRSAASAVADRYAQFKAPKSPLQVSNSFSYDLSTVVGYKLVFVARSLQFVSVQRLGCGIVGCSTEIWWKVFMESDRGWSGNVLSDLRGRWKRKSLPYCVHSEAAQHF